MQGLGPEFADAASNPALDETELVRRAQLGSASAFEQLVVTHGPRLHRYLAVRVRDGRDVRDILQETLTAAWVGLPKLNEPAKFWPWLVGIALHKAADSARAHVRPTDAEVELAAADDDRGLEIREAVFALPAHLREVLLLRYLVRLSEEEAAEALGVRVGTVKSRSARARAALLELLA